MNQAFAILAFATTIAAIGAPELVDSKSAAKLYVVKVTFPPKQRILAMEKEWYHEFPQDCQLGVNHDDKSKPPRFQVACEGLIPAEFYLSDLPVKPNRYRITRREGRVYINY